MKPLWKIEVPDDIKVEWVEQGAYLQLGTYRVAVQCQEQVANAVDILREEANAAKSEPLPIGQLVRHRASGEVGVVLEQQYTSYNVAIGWGKTHWVTTEQIEPCDRRPPTVEESLEKLVQLMTGPIKGSLTPEQVAESQRELGRYVNAR